MFIGREKELLRLEKCYKSTQANAALVYGREGIGKTTFIKKFCENKNLVYYQARELSEKEQLAYFEKKKQEVEEKISEEKLCFVIDEVDLMAKGYKSFFADLSAYIKELEQKNVFVILVSSSIQWVEDSMMDDLISIRKNIADNIKLEEFTFMEMVDRFPNSTNEECITIYGILGGVPAYLDYWNPKETIKKNIIRIVLSPNGPMHKEAGRFLKTSLRELPFYSTILSVLAEDEPKLNYLYNRTGFSRAKISVYIKNLMQIGVTEKLYSYEPEKKQSIQKGLYCIKDAFIQFYYKLIYPNLSELSIMDEETFFDTFIKKQLDEIVAKAYIKVCQEFMNLMNQFNKLPSKFSDIGSLYGKKGYIPLVANGTNDELLVGYCKWSKKPVSMSDFEEFLENIEQIGKDADYYYLFSKEGFTNDVSMMTNNMDNIQCIDLEQM